MTHDAALLPHSQIEISIIVPFEEFESHVKRAAVLISEEKEIEGFRTGKAPFEIVKKKFGELHIYEVAAELAVKATYHNILESFSSNPPAPLKQFVPIGAPSVTVTKLAPGNELTYKAVVSFLPEVTLPDYAAIARETMRTKKEISVSDEELDKTLEWLRESRVELESATRAAQQGDAVEIDFELRSGGVKIANGESRNHPLVIGKGKFMPGFEDNLIGMTENEVKNFSLAVPGDWHEKSFAGRAIDVKAAMKSVKERHVPELTDEFAKKLGDFNSVDALKKNIREGLSTEKEEKERQRVRAHIIETIAERATIDPPEVLVESELEKMFHEMKSNVESMGMKWEDYMMHIKKNQEELKTEWRDDSMKRVRIALVLREIAAREHIEPTDEEIDKQANRHLARFSNIEEARHTIDPKRLREYAGNVLRNEKVFEFLESGK